MSEAEIIRPFDGLEDAPHPSESQSCESCIFWSIRNDGKCHRNPPVVVDTATTYNVSVWPSPDPSDWCGEWSSKDRKLFRWTCLPDTPPPWPTAMTERYRK